jgi:hypothetical protein
VPQVGVNPLIGLKRPLLHLTLTRADSRNGIVIRLIVLKEGTHAIESIPNSYREEVRMKGNESTVPLALCSPDDIVLKTSPVVVFQTLMVASHEADTALPDVSIVMAPSEPTIEVSSFRRTQREEIQPVCPLSVRRHSPVAASQICQR